RCSTNKGNPAGPGEVLKDGQHPYTSLIRPGRADGSPGTSAEFRVQSAGSPEDRGEGGQRVLTPSPLLARRGGCGAMCLARRVRCDSRGQAFCVRFSALCTLYSALRTALPRRTRLKGLPWYNSCVGAVAHLGERCVRIAEVGGSNPPSSTRLSSP